MKNNENIFGGGVPMRQLTDESFEALITKYHSLLVSIAYSYMYDNFYAEDIVQDSFIKLYRARKRFESEEHIRVTINGCLNALKRKAKELLIETECINNLPDTSDADKGKNEDIYSCICSLKDEYKTIFILHYYDNYSLKEIANILKISESNASSRLVRARCKLKKIILERRKNDER